MVIMCREGVSEETLSLPARPSDDNRTCCVVMAFFVDWSDKRSLNLLEALSGLKRVQNRILTAWWIWMLLLHDIRVDACRRAPNVQEDHLLEILVYLDFSNKKNWQLSSAVQ